jgi:alpha-beta hydrolase superfamily lysophospholipase
VGLALAALALLYGLVIGLLWSQQEKLLFRPSALPADFRFDMPADVQESWVEVPGARLNALHLRLPKPDGVVFYLHGNAGDLSTWFVNSDYYRRLNLDLYILDYRGFGKSSGHIESQAQLLDDVRAAWQGVAPRYAGLRRIIAGRSIGTGLAAALAAQVQPELTVLISPYFSMQDLAQSIYPWVPAAVLRYPLRTDLWMPRIQGPVLLTHGEQDSLIPIQHSERLLARSPQAALLRVPQAAHNDIQRFPDYLDGLARVLQVPARVAELRTR